VTDLKRPDWDLWFMRQAYVVAQRGSCRRKRVGAVIVRDRDKRVVSGGYNGSPRGLPDCLELGCDVRSIDGRDSCVRTLHAESNALDLAGLVDREPHTLYTTVYPCRNCAMRIVQHGIHRVVYHEYYESQGTKEVAAMFAQPNNAQRTLGAFGNLGSAGHLVRLTHLNVPADTVSMDAFREAALTALDAMSDYGNDGKRAQLEAFVARFSERW
jgi:dCMP deaminase